MENETLPSRSLSSVFKSYEDLLFFYEEILLFYESERKSYGDKSILKKASEKVSNKFGFVYENYEEQKDNPKDNTFYFDASPKSKKSKKRTVNVVEKWFHHLRNAFAHNYITMEDNNYILCNYIEKGRNYKLVMYALITNFADFKNLIKEIKLLQNENNDSKNV